MKLLAVSAVALSALGFANVAHAQGAKVFFEGDVIRGAQAGAPPPFCVLNNQFKRLEKVVFRLRVLDADGKTLDDKGLKSLVVELPDGKKIEAKWGQHPPRGEASDHFWTAAWQIPADYPSGTFSYKATATDQNGQTKTWEPFKVKTSQFQVADAAVEIKAPPPGQKK